MAGAMATRSAQTRRPHPRFWDLRVFHGVFGVKISIIFYIGQAQSMRAVESFPSIYDTEVLLLVLLLHASTRSQRQGRRAVWFPKKWLSKNAGRTLRRKLFDGLTTEAFCQSEPGNQIKAALDARATGTVIAASSLCANPNLTGTSRRLSTAPQRLRGQW